jgi:hypothetical protein
MPSLYQFKISSPWKYIRSILLSFLVPAVYVGLILLLFPPETRVEHENLFFFIGGACWFIGFFALILRASEQMECEVGESGLTLRQNSKLSVAAKSEEMRWTDVESFSFTKDYNGYLVRVKFKDHRRGKWISIPTISNNEKQVERFINEFRSYANQHNSFQSETADKIKEGKSFYQSRFARIIGYIIIAYLVIITFVKTSGLDGGRLEWSNIIYTFVFGVLYLSIVFWKRG